MSPLRFAILKVRTPVDIDTTLIDERIERFTASAVAECAALPLWCCDLLAQPISLPSGHCSPPFRPSDQIFRHFQGLCGQYASAPCEPKKTQNYNMKRTQASHSSCDGSEVFWFMRCPIF
jgi:hypothetical protein